jgi:glutamate formiminotransferase/formiminotetrahydrofolate cyclodeaminase
VLHVDSGYAANRTVVTFAGEPEAVIEAAFEAVQIASMLIDMQMHKGIHPRLGAVDVLPLVPVSGISMDEVVELSKRLADRIGHELQIPVYCYEYSAQNDYRRRLESIRLGEYEGLEEKMKNPLWQPNFGPLDFNPHSGATIIGARNFLVAYNVNLATQSVDIAKKIAAEVRESGYQVVEHGLKKSIPGLLKSVKAIGWHIADFNRVQVSMNLTNIEETPVHKAFETVRDVAYKYETFPTGSELIGLIPLKALTEAGAFYSQHRMINEKEQIQKAIECLGLSELTSFLPKERILEYKLVKLL